MTERDFKVLLLDLDLSLAEIGRLVGTSQWTVTLYFRGELVGHETRRRIKRVLEERAAEKDVSLPPFWEDAA